MRLTPKGVGLHLVAALYKYPIHTQTPDTCSCLLTLLLCISPAEYGVTRETNLAG